MPAVIAAGATAWAASSVVSAAVGAGLVAAGGFGAAMIYTGVSMAASAVLGKALGLNQPPPQFSAMDRGLLLNTAGSVDPIFVVYGLRRIGGTRVFMETSGASNQYLHIVTAHCEGPVSAIGNVYLDGIDSADSKFANLVTVERFLGGDDQAACASLMAALPDKWTADHRLRGVAYTYVKIKFDNTVFHQLPTITADISGRPCFDPRDGQIKATSNYALAIRDYLTHARYGRAIPAGEIDDASFIVAANYCDQSITTPSGSQPRYTCNGVINTDNNSISNLQAMLTGCRGMLLFVGGKYRLVLDKAEVATFDFNEDNIVGAWSLKPGTKRTRFNRVRARWFNPSLDWNPDLAVADSSAFRTIDNGLLLEDQLELPFTTNTYEAQILADRHCKQSRYGWTVSFRATIAGMLCECGQVVTISHATPGWVAKPFRILRMTLLSSCEVEIVAAEYDDAIYADTALTAPSTAPQTTLPDPASVPEPTNLQIAVQHTTQADGTVTSAMVATWDAAPSIWVVGWDIAWREDGGPWQTTIALEPRWPVGAVAGRSYDVRVRSISTLGGMRSDWLPLNGVTATPPDVPPAAPVVTASAALFSVALAWTFGDARQDIRATEIWFASSNDRSLATRLSSEPFPGRAYEHPGLNPGQGGYYWLRVVDTVQNPSAWYPVSATGGLHAVASTDPSQLLAMLQGTLGEPELAASLAERIDLIDTVGPPDTPTGLLNRVRAQAGELAVLNTDTDALSNSLLDAALRLQTNTDLLYDAGVYVEPATGNVKITGVEALKDRLTTAEVSIDAQSAAITSRVTQTQMDEAIAAAVLDPVQVAELSGLTGRVSAVEVELDAANTALSSKAALSTVNAVEVRVSTAEADIDALQSEINLKVANSTFNALESRVTTAETDLNAIDGAAITQTVMDQRNLRRQRDEDAYTWLREVISGQATRTASEAGIAAARTDLTAYVNEQVVAEATARIALAVAVSEVSAGLQSEQTTRASETDALSLSLDALTATVGEQSATISSEQSARASGDNVNASAINTLQARLDSGDFASVKTTATATADAVEGLAAEYGVQVQIIQDNIPVVAGFKLLSDVSGSAFAILADKLLFYRPDGGGLPVQAFTLGTVDGQTHLVLAGNLIADGSVIARHLSVDSLDAVSGTIGLLRTAATGARMELADNVIKVFDAAGALRVKIGNLAL